MSKQNERLLSMSAERELALRAQVERLTAERDRMIVAATDSANNALRFMEQRDRLAKALSFLLEVADNDVARDYEVGEFQPVLEDAMSTARAALESIK